MQKQAAWGLNVREIAEQQPETGQKMQPRSLLLWMAHVWNFHARMDPAVWEGQRTKRAPSRRVRRAILRDGW